VRELHPETRGLPGLWIALFVILTLLTSRSLYLQVLTGSKGAQAAEGNRTRLRTTTPNRGLITDSKGTPLAMNSQQTALVVLPAELPRKKTEREAVYEKLRTITSFTSEQQARVEEAYSNIGNRITLKTPLTKEETLLLKEQIVTLPGVAVVEVPIRTYVDFASAGHLLGYVAPPSRDERQGLIDATPTGIAGVEKFYNETLRGTNGTTAITVDARGVPQGESTVVSPVVEGKNLVLGIDADVQKVTADALKQQLEIRQKNLGDLPKLGATAVVIDPRNGVVRALVSYPDFSPNQFTKGISQEDYTTLSTDPGNPLLNRATQALFPSGSVIKPFVAAVALEAGVINGNTAFATPKELCVAGTCFPDWKFHPGVTDARRAIAESNNIFFYAIGGGYADANIKGLGIEKLANGLAKFGLGESYQPDFGSANGGVIPTPDWKRKRLKESWFLGDTYNTSIGQGYTQTNPMQIALATAAIANGGTLYEPSAGEYWQDAITKEKTRIEPRTNGSVGVSDGNMRVIREGMRQGVTSGSSRLLDAIPVPIAGKTGSAQFGPNKELTQSWFTSYAPYDNPEYVVTVLIEGAGEGYLYAVPTADAIYRKLFNQPPPAVQTQSTDVAGFAGER
jgi:penicillin-binding protein 2